MNYRYPAILYQTDMYEDDWSIQCVIEAFQERPCEFEYLCAELLSKKYGYDVGITNAVKDGGYDLVCYAGNQVQMLVECKCYDSQNRVGRPALQKLVGANALLHVPQLSFITTSEYTSDAMEYAARIGIQLYDGHDVEHWMRCYFQQ